MDNRETLLLLRNLSALSIEELRDIAGNGLQSGDIWTPSLVVCQRPEGDWCYWDRRENCPSKRDGFKTEGEALTVGIVDKGVTQEFIAEYGLLDLPENFLLNVIDRASQGSLDKRVEMLEQQITWMWKMLSPGQKLIHFGSEAITEHVDSDVYDEGRDQLLASQEHAIENGARASLLDRLVLRFPGLAGLSEDVNGGDLVGFLNQVIAENVV
ncbi:hypothetical protein [Paraburkholderia sp. J8-2]|uniref:hypothetical protein n=1 Tax=Paraburkholderia sp. J8-2 TaxID=2805440 RepID=UPI002AB7AEC3|nr:hypothetical protein [Paraburkholderia sp. J8-2]